MPESTAQQKKSLLTAAVAHTCQDGLDASTYVLLPILANVFGLSYAQIGGIKAAKSIALGALELISGFLTERFGESRILVTGLLIAGVSYAAVAITESVYPLVLCLIVVGIGGGLQHAPASALVSNTYSSHNKRSALGLYNASGDVGKLLFTATFSAALSAGVLWHQVVFSFGTISIIAALFIVVLLSMHKPLKRPAPDTAIQKTTSDDAKHGNTLNAASWGVLKPRLFSILIVVVFIDNAVQVGVLVFVAFLLLESELPIGLATAAPVMVLVGGVFGKAGCGYLAQRLGVRRSFALVQWLTAAALISVVAAPDWLAFALLLPLGVVSQGSTTITYGLLPDYIHPDRMARGYAMLYSSTSIAAAAGAWLIGLAADHYGIDSAFLLMAVLSVAAWLPIFLFLRVSPCRPC